MQKVDPQDLLVIEQALLEKPFTSIEEWWKNIRTTTDRIVYTLTPLQKYLMEQTLH